MISASDRRLVVLRNGIVIGRAPVTIDGEITRTTAYMLRAATGSGQSWMRLGLPGQEADSGTELRGRIHVPESFRRAVEAILQPGATVVVTEDSLGSGGAGRAMTVVEGEGQP